MNPLEKSFPILRLASLVVAASIGAACGDDPDTTRDTGSGTDATDATSGTDTAAGDDTASGDTGTDTLTATDAASGTDAATTDDTANDTSDTGPTELVKTAVVSVDGQAATVTPATLRGMSLFAKIERSFFAPVSQEIVLSCGGTDRMLQGGRGVVLSSLTLVGGFGSNCPSISTVEALENNWESQLRQNCNGLPSCTLNLYESFDLNFGGCSHNEASFSVLYTCDAHQPAPIFGLDVTTPFGTLRTAGLEGRGAMSCADRGVGFTVDGAPVQPKADTACTIDITTKSSTSIAGTIEATLVVGGADRVVDIAFTDEATTTNPRAGTLSTTDVCVGPITVGTPETRDGDTWDVVSADGLPCQVNPASPQPAFTFSVRRLRADESIDQWFDGGDPPFVFESNGLRSPSTFTDISAFSVDNDADRLRLVIWGLQLCVDGDVTNCPTTIPVTYVQFAR